MFVGDADNLYDSAKNESKFDDRQHNEILASSLI